MNKSEIAVLNRVIVLLQSLTDEPQAVDPGPGHCPVAIFARKYLARDPGSDVTSAELWTFFNEVAATGEVDPLSKAEFLRRLPAVMRAAFDVKKSHAVESEGGRRRGFKGITLREQA